MNIEQIVYDWWVKNGKGSTYKLRHLYRSEEKRNRYGLHIPNLSDDVIDKMIVKFRGGYVPIERMGELSEFKGYTTIDEPRINKFKILYFDIETTSFGADFGEILMFSYCWNDNIEDVRNISVLDFPECFELTPERSDLPVVKELVKLINEADVVVAHYGSKFDLRFLQARLVIHGLPIADIKWAKIFDTCITSRKNLKLQSNRLDAVAEALGIEQRKDHLDKKYWRRSHCIGNKYFEDAILKMIDYCNQDVVVLYYIAKKLMPLTRHLPSYQAIANVDHAKVCRICGSENLESNGFDNTKANKYTRYQCKDCGAWQRAVVPVNKVAPEKRTMY